MQPQDLILVQSQPAIMTELIEIFVPQGSARVQLPDVQQLRSQEGQQIIITKLKLITDDILASGVDLSGTVMPLNELQNIVLTLYSMGWERGHNIPLLLLNSQTNNANSVNTYNDYTLANWMKVDWPKSYLKWCSGASAGDNYIVPLYVEYLKLNAEGQQFVSA